MEHIYNFRMITLKTRPLDGVLFSKDNLPESAKMQPYITGKGALNYNCGKCNHPILKSIRRIQIVDAVYKCPKCGTFNRVAPR